MKIMIPKHTNMHSKNFTFGVATASFQIEGGVNQRLPCIWDTFCAKENTIADQSNGNVACNHVELWQEDIDLIESLGVDAYRLSISWGRVINQDGSVNQSGMQFYKDILATLAEKNIKAFVTLYHWDLPQHLEDNGGWLNRETALKFQDYTEKVVAEFQGLVHSYATLNEPFCSAYLGYELGIHAPGLTGAKYGKQSAHHLLLAHGLAMEVLRKKSPNTLNGIVLNFTPCYPESLDPKDKKAADYADDYLNHWYAQPILEGRYPQIISDLPLDHQPTILEGDLAIISQPIDFLGVNYYTRAVYKADDENIYTQTNVNHAEFTDMGWEIYPKGFSDLLTSLHEKYTLPPIYITENGAAMPDVITDGKINDTKRVEYFQSHLSAVNDAIEQGVDIRGYFAWSLMDNFEWAEGYLKRFGIVYVDYQTQKRTIKASGLAYRDFINQRN